MWIPENLSGQWSHNCLVWAGVVLDRMEPQVVDASASLWSWRCSRCTTKNAANIHFFYSFSAQRPNWARLLCLPPSPAPPRLPGSERARHLSPPVGQRRSPRPTHPSDVLVYDDGHLRAKDVCLDTRPCAWWHHHRRTVPPVNAVTYRDSWLVPDFSMLVPFPGPVQDTLFTNANCLQLLQILSGADSICEGALSCTNTLQTTRNPIRTK